MRWCSVVAVGALGSAFLLGSCSKDKRIERTLRGEWKASKSGSSQKQQMVISNSTNTSILPEARTGNANPQTLSVFDISVDASGTYTFNKDNTGSANLTLTQKLSQDGNLISNVSISVNTTFKWEVKDQQLIIEYSDGSKETYKIVSWSDSEVKCEMEGSGCVNGSIADPTSGSMINFSICYNLTLTK